MTSPIGSGIEAAQARVAAAQANQIATGKELLDAQSSLGIDLRNQNYKDALAELNAAEAALTAVQRTALVANASALTGAAISATAAALDTVFSTGVRFAPTISGAMAAQNAL